VWHSVLSERSTGWAMVTESPTESKVTIHSRVRAAVRRLTPDPGADAAQVKVRTLLLVISVVVFVATFILLAFFLVQNEARSRWFNALSLLIDSLALMVAFWSRYHHFRTAVPETRAGRMMSRRWAWTLSIVALAMMIGSLWWGAWFTLRSGIDAVGFRAGALVNGQSVLWQPATGDVARHRLAFTPRLTNADQTGFCADTSRITATLYVGTAVQQRSTVGNGERISLDLGPKGSTRIVQLQVQAPPSCRLDLVLDDPRFTG
jgi:hypothetical protein